MTVSRLIVSKLWYVWVRCNLGFLKDMCRDVAYSYNIKKGYRWEDGINSELRFWRSWLGSKGLSNPEVFDLCVDPALPLQEDLVMLLEKSQSHNEKLKSILDVGSGPLTQIGKQHDSWEIEITPVDALADKYAGLLKEYDLSPLVKTVNGKVEILSTLFKEGRFDLVCMSNALDHSEDPMLGLEEMLKVTKPGCYVVLKHAINEAEKEKYRGFHKWNLCSENSDFVIWNKTEQFNVSKMLSSRADIGVAIVGEFIVVHILKKLPKSSACS